MQTNKFGQFVYTEQEICDLYLQNPDRVIQTIICNDQISFLNDLGLDNIPKIVKECSEQTSITEFDKDHQNNWKLPEPYKTMDIAQFVLDQCKTDAELQRAGQELLLFQERNMFPILKYLKYLVDTMRENNIVWGVGRGSSVASFVLYLIGIHRINSLYYDLSIEEFLK